MTTARRAGFSSALMIIAVVIAAFNLRPAIAAVGAVLGEITTLFGASGSVAGLLTAMPGLFFALFGVAAVPLARRIGLTGSLVVAVIIGAVGQLARPFVGNIVSFVALTGMVAMGIAVTNVLLPAWIKTFGGRRTVMLMTCYTTVLGIGSTLGPLGPVIIGGDMSDNWHWTLLLWAIPAVAQLVVWGYVLIISQRPALKEKDKPTEENTSGSGTLWRSPTAIAIMVFFALQSMNAYIQMGWLPLILTDAGTSTSTAAGALSVIGVMTIIAGLTVPTLVDRMKHLGPAVIVFAGSSFAGYIGLWLAPTAAPYVWAVLLGIGGFCFILILSLIPQRTSAPSVTARLSGFAQPVGYLLAAAGPFIVGVIYQALGDWQLTLIGLAALAVVMGFVGFRAAAPALIDDELAAQTPRSDRVK